MPRCLTRTPHLPDTEGARRSRTCRDAVERSHWQMVWRIRQGHRAPEVARLTGSSETWVRTIMHRSNADGPDGLIDRRHANPGKPPIVSSAVREELRQRLATPPPDGGLWTGPTVATGLTERRDRSVSPQRAWEPLRALGFTLHRPRLRAMTADPAAQDACKHGA